jgi:flagellin
MSTFSIRSNATTSRAYNNLSKVQSSLNSNIERLSSGLRINSASDDSAGSSVAVRMVSQINGMKQANSNAQQANNLFATAESGLGDISDILGRMRELAVQASTDTLNDEDRDSIDLEFQALGDEITRIASATEYDDNPLLDGSYTGKKLQIGADNDANHQLDGIGIKDVTESGLGLGAVGEVAAVTAVTAVTEVLAGDGTVTTAAVEGVTGVTGVTYVAGHDANVDTVDDARDAIGALDAAIDTVNHERSEIGALQNRLSFTISNLSNHTQAIEAGRSAIADVDFAAEATALARNQILAQSGTAMLAQASVVSQNVLGLLM